MLISHAVVLKIHYIILPVFNKKRDLFHLLEFCNYKILNKYKSVITEKLIVFFDPKNFAIKNHNL